MRTTYFTATTLDGFIADEHDSLEWLFKQDVRDEGALSYADFIKDIGAMAMGATTYQWLIDHLAKTGEDWLYDIPSWVHTHREFEPIGAGITFTADPVPQVHAAMAAAAGGKDVWIVGGGDLAGQYAEHGLLDEIIVSIAPVTLGAGRPLFPRRYDLELVEHLRNGAFVCARYAVSGPL
ncbi:dihydrofolate reductase family protein [Nocardioides hungaricus]